MTYLRRKADAALVQWRSQPERKPLVVKGPRQVGKTETIRHFAASYYESVININFAEEPKYKTITSDGYDAVSVVRNISLLDPGKRFIPGSTLLFFDEVQEFPDIATSLKFFKLDGRFDVICSGSMLGINYGAIESNSVGYKVDYNMRSLDFEEFLWALGYDDAFSESLFEKLTCARALSEAEATALSARFMDYVILGGMPEVVSTYVSRATFEGSLSMQRQLIADYREDIQRYAAGLDKTRVLNVFDHIPVQLAKENKKFQVGKVARGARFKDYRGCVEWLEIAGLANVCHCLYHPELPLKGNYDETKYKIYVADTGLLVSMLDEEASDDLRANKNLDVYKGALYENMVAEALVKQGYGLYYYKKDDSTLEQDFFVRTQEYLVPVEVKARGGRSKSLRTLIESGAYPDIAFGVKMHAGNIGCENHVLTMPYALAFLLRRLLRGFEEWKDLRARLLDA